MQDSPVTLLKPPLLSNSGVLLRRLYFVIVSASRYDIPVARDESADIFFNSPHRFDYA